MVNGSTSLQGEFLEQVQSICHSFGLYGTVMFYRPSPIPESKCNKAYLVVGSSPEIEDQKLQSNFDPEYFLRRNLRNERVVYTDYFVYELGPDCNYMDVTEKLIEHCKFTEFLTSLYRSFRMGPPLRLRRFEIRQLMDARDHQRAALSDRIWHRSTDFLNQFFEREKKRGMQKEWMSFFRSEKYPDEGSMLEKANAFRKRNNSEISLEQLMACNSSIHTLEMQEHEYKRFSDVMSSQFPYVPYSVSEKIILDNKSSRTDAIEEGSPEIKITGEAYDRIVEDRFAEESWDCISSYCPCYFEIRKVSYAAVDEPYVASAFQNAVLRYARSNDLQTIEGRGGALRLFHIPKEDFMNFVSLAKANELPFFIDTMGLLEVPSLKKISVIYSSTDEILFQDILARIVGEKVACSHLIPDDERKPLQARLQNADIPFLHEPDVKTSELQDFETR